MAQAFYLERELIASMSFHVAGNVGSYYRAQKWRIKCSPMHNRKRGD